MNYHVVQYYYYLYQREYYLEIAFNLLRKMK